jgi:hypothetical protein
VQPSDSSRASAHPSGWRASSSRARRSSSFSSIISSETLRPFGPSWESKHFGIDRDGTPPTITTHMEELALSSGAPLILEPRQCGGELTGCRFRRLAPVGGLELQTPALGHRAPAESLIPRPAEDVPSERLPRHRLPLRRSSPTNRLTGSGDPVSNAGSSQTQPPLRRAEGSQQRDPGSFEIPVQEIPRCQSKRRCAQAGRTFRCGDAHCPEQAKERSGPPRTLSPWRDMFGRSALQFQGARAY